MTSFLFYYMILLVLRQVFIVILSWKSLQDFTLGTFYLNAFISIFFIEDGVLKPVNIREKIPSPICCFFPSLLSSSRPLLFKLNIPLFPLNLNLFGQFPSPLTISILSHLLQTISATSLYLLSF